MCGGVILIQKMTYILAEGHLVKIAMMRTVFLIIKKWLKITVLRKDWKD